MISPVLSPRFLRRLALVSAGAPLLLSLLTAAPAAHAQAKQGKKDQKSTKSQSGQSPQSGQKGLNFTAMAEPPARSGFYTNSYAIIIGISHYKDATKNLDYAAADAQALAQILEKSYDFPENNVTVLTDEKATRENIEKALSEIQDPKKYTEHTRVIIFFSGHGQTVKDKLGLDKGFLIPYDAEVDMQHLEDEGSYMKTCLRMDTIWGYLTNTTVNLHALLIADACYGGLLVSKARGFAGDGDSSDRPSPPVVANLMARNALEALTAGGAGEPVIENSAWGHGAFTYKLLEALQDRAKKPNDIFLASQLATFLETSVGNLTKGRQTPQFGKRDSEGDVVFYTAGATSSIKPNTAGVTPHPANGRPEQGNAQGNDGESGAVDFSELAGQKLTVQPEERLSTNDVQQGAEVRFLVVDDLKDSKGNILIPAKTPVIGHVSSRYKAVSGGNLGQSFAHYGQDSKLGVSCDYILTSYKKIPLQKNNYSIGGSMGSGMFRMDGKRDRVMKPENTFIKVKIVDNLTSTGSEAPSTKDE